MTTDVLIIGGGVAGVAAALAATEAGATTLLVRSGPGATALAAGAWPSPAPEPLDRALAAAGLELVTCSGAVPHPDGHLVRAAQAPTAIAVAAFDDPGAPDAPPRNGTLICAIAGLPSFRAAALAALWADAAGLPAPLPHVTLSLTDTPPGGWSPAGLAALLEREPDRLGDALARAAREFGADRVIVPAVLGTDDHPRVHASIQSSAGVPVGEALGVAPSVPGWRLDRALMRALAAAGVTVVAGRVSRFDESGGRVRSVTVGATTTGSTTITAGLYVLATGKFVGGGIAMDGRFADTVFGSDVAVNRHGRAFTSSDSTLVLTDPVRTEPQPVMGAGVATDADGHMLSADGNVVFSNVFVAGSVRAGVETATTDLGTSAHDGWSAGLKAASHTDSTAGED